ncbi:MAG: hypothetical protein DBY04_04110 [Clostridiales bacterium]|nr:MAG: hypothetical protein DBY04_04110 [Clostridiales bacterium]
MKSGSAPKQKGQNALLVLLRDIFTGGKGYRTIKGDKTPFPTTIVLCAAAVTVLFLALVFALIRVSAISAEIADMKKEIVGLASEEDTLQGELNRKYSFEEIENTAGELGLSNEGGQTIILDDTIQETAEQTES